MKSPKGLGWLASFSLGSQDILHRPCQPRPNTGKHQKEMKNMAFFNQKPLFIDFLPKNILRRCMKTPNTFLGNLRICQCKTDSQAFPLWNLHQNHWELI